MDRLDKMVGAIHKAQKSSQQTSFSTKQMTSMDDLTHNFTSDREITRYMLAKYGQVFIDGKRYTA